MSTCVWTAGGTSRRQWRSALAPTPRTTSTRSTSGSASSSSRTLAIDGRARGGKGPPRAHRLARRIADSRPCRLTHPTDELGEPLQRRLQLREGGEFDFEHVAAASVRAERDFFVEFPRELILKPLGLHVGRR